MGSVWNLLIHAELNFSLNLHFFESTKEHLLSDDNEVVEWDEDFTNAVDFDEEYALYLNEGGAEEDVVPYVAVNCHTGCYLYF